MEDFAELLRELSECQTSEESPGLSRDDDDRDREIVDQIIKLAREWVERQHAKPAEPA